MVLTWQNKKYILETFSALKNLVINCRKELVVYFNQFLGAGYSKRLLKHAFLFILHQKIKKLKKKEKARKSRQILAKNMFFECPLKQVFRCIKLYFLGIKPSNSVWVNFDYICHQFPIWKFAHTMTQVSAFLSFSGFGTNKIEKSDFYQGLEWAAPKHWSKHTTSANSFPHNTNPK